MGVERQKELQAGQVPQLAPRPECRPDNVCDAENRENGTIYDGSRGKIKKKRGRGREGGRTPDPFAVVNFAN